MKERVQDVFLPTNAENTMVRTYNKCIIQRKVTTKKQLITEWEVKLLECITKKEGMENLLLLDTLWAREADECKE